GRGIAVRVPRIATGERAGRRALGLIPAFAFVVIVFSTATPSVLVPGSQITYPGWFSGPLHGVFGHLIGNSMAISIGFTVAILAMFAAYASVLASVRHLSLKVIAGAVVAANLIFLLGPPLQLTDVFNYIGYARLGALHHLNPYTHGLSWAAHD